MKLQEAYKQIDKHPDYPEFECLSDAISECALYNKLLILSKSVDFTKYDIKNLSDLCKKYIQADSIQQKNLISIDIGREAENLYNEMLNGADTNDAIRLDNGLFNSLANKLTKNLSIDQLISKSGLTVDDKFNYNAPAFILPNGKIFSYAGDSEDTDYNTHVGLIYSLYKNVIKQNYPNAIFKTNEDAANSLMRDFTDELGVIRVNFGTAAVENRFYCVLPPLDIKPTDIQYSKLQQFLDWGLEHSKDKVLVFFGSGNETIAHNYFYHDYTVDDILKSIQKTYAFNHLVEYIDKIESNSGSPIIIADNPDEIAYFIKKHSHNYYRLSVYEHMNSGKIIQLYILSDLVEMIHADAVWYAVKNGYLNKEDKDYSYTCYIFPKTVLKDKENLYDLLGDYDGYDILENQYDKFVLYCIEDTNSFINTAFVKALGAPAETKIFKIEELLSDEEENEEVDESIINESPEKHNTLNPKLWDVETNELKPEVHDKILEIANEFTDGLKQDGIKFKVNDIRLVGSNCSFNYTEDSDLDVHIIMDSDSLNCPDNLYPLLYSSYRSIFNKNLDIDFYGVPVEIYVEMDNEKPAKGDEPVSSTAVKSNGIYSVMSGKWIKEPVQADIPDIDEGEFDKLFTKWEDRYFALVGDVNSSK